MRTADYLVSLGDSDCVVTIIVTIAINDNLVGMSLDILITKFLTHRWRGRFQRSLVDRNFESVFKRVAGGFRCLKHSAFGDVYPSHATVNNWIASLQRGKSSVGDDKKPGRLISVSTNVIRTKCILYERIYLHQVPNYISFWLRKRLLNQNGFFKYLKADQK